MVGVWRAPFLACGGGLVTVSSRGRERDRTRSLASPVTQAQIPPWARTP